MMDAEEQAKAAIDTIKANHPEAERDAVMWKTRAERYHREDRCLGCVHE